MYTPRVRADSIDRVIEIEVGSEGVLSAGSVGV